MAVSTKPSAGAQAQTEPPADPPAVDRVASVSYNADGSPAQTPGYIVLESADDIAE